MKINQNASHLLPMFCLLFVATGVRSASAVTIEPNAPSGTNIDTYYISDGVTFSNPAPNPPGSDSNIYAVDGYFAFLPNSGISMNPYAGIPTATFSTLQSTVSIDATPEGSFEGQGPDPKNDPSIMAYDSQDNLIGYTSYPEADLPANGGAGATETLTFTSTSADIASVIFDDAAVPYSDGESAEFQNLSFDVVPEPSTWTMMLGGLSLLAFFGFRAHRSQS